jgi:MoaA/NifB/PqqE/SkfB family radical SAM enzyme
MVNESIAEMLRESPPFAMEVSIYGADQEHYEGTTGIKGSFARFVRGIRLLQEANVPLTLKTPFSDITSDHGDALVAFCRERGLPFRYDFSLSPRHDGGQQPTLHRIAPKRVAQMRGALLAEERSSGHFDPLPECSDAPPGNAASSDDLYQCGAGRIGFFIDGLGYASHCVIDREPRFPLLEMSWDEVWAGIGGWVTQKLPEDAPCSGCSLRGGCNNCPARSRLATGSPYLKDTYFCDTTHALHGLDPVQHPDYRAIARERQLGMCIR